jgi:hypothetical protein
MTSPVYRRADCRLCAGRDLATVLPFPPMPVGDAYVAKERLQKPTAVYPMDLSLCLRCGHAQLRDVVDPKILYDNFIYQTSISLGLVDHFRRYAQDVMEYVKPPTGSLAVDIGSNDGTVLKFFQAEGMRVLGVEPAREIALKASAAGVETWPEFFSSEMGRRIKAEHGPASIVTINNTFANVDDLDDMLEGVRGLLAPEGVLVIETGYLFDLALEGLFDNIYHEHLGYFSVKPLQTFLQRHHLELIHVERIATKGGSLRALAQRAGGPRSVSTSVERLLTLEKEAGIDRPDIYRALDSRMESQSQRLRDLLKGLKAQGKTIAGYGASVGTTTFLYRFQLGDLLSFIADDNPAKHHLFSPGHHVPVLPSESLYTERPDYVVILAWRYSAPIMEKHQDYLAQGGRFILPWPELAVK